MKLSELSLSGIEIARDAEFSSIGGLNESKAKALVKASDKNEISIATRNKSVSCVLTKKEFVPSVPGNIGIAVSGNPERSIVEIHNQLAKTSFYGGESENAISGKARIHPTAVIGKAGIRIGDGCRIGPKAVILDRTVLEDNVSIGAGSVVGCDPELIIGKGDQAIAALSTGGVLVRKNAEVHCNCSISRAVFGGNTVIDEETKIDNLVSISQNAKIGKRCLLVAAATIGADAVIGDDVWIGPNAVVSDSLVVGDGAYITLGAVVVENVKSGSKVTGNFAIDHQKFLDFLKRIR